MHGATGDSALDQKGSTKCRRALLPREAHIQAARRLRFTKVDLHALQIGLQLRDPLVRRGPLGRLWHGLGQVV